MASNIVSRDSSPSEEPYASTPVRFDVPGERSSATSAVTELFRRWPAVPSRELERIRRALLQCESTGYGGSGHQLSEPARAVLDLITAELERRRRDTTAHRARPGGRS